MFGEARSQEGQHYCGIGRINQHQLIGCGPLNDIGVIVLEQRYCNDSVTLEELLHDILILIMNKIDEWECIERY